MCFTIEEIKHGILRGNRKQPGSYFKPLSGSDPKNNLLQLRDPRIIFVFFEEQIIPKKLELLNANDYEDKLDKFTKAYLSHTVCFDTLEGDIILPKIIENYKDDFGSSSYEIISWVLKYVNTKIITNPEEIKKGVKDNRITVSFSDS